MVRVVVRFRLSGNANAKLMVMVMVTSTLVLILYYQGITHHFHYRSMPHKLTVLGDGRVLLVCAISREEVEYEYRPEFNSITILRHHIVIIY
jgi:hypothetical protein